MLIGIWTGTSRAAKCVIVVVSLGVDVTRQISLLFWEWLNWMHPCFRQIVRLFQAEAGSHCSGDLCQWDLFNGLIWSAAECSVLGIKSWLCHVNPKEEAAWSRMAPGAEEASRHAPGTVWSLYSLGPSGERSQHWPLSCFLGGETTAHEGGEETPSLRELLNTWRCCLLLQSVFIGAGSLCLLNQRRISFETRNKTEPVLWHVWRGVKAGCRK